MAVLTRLISKVHERFLIRHRKINTLFLIVGTIMKHNIIMYVPSVAVGKQKIQFSNDPKPSDKECHRLLQHYMDKHHIGRKKIDQKLFVRLVNVI